MTDLTSAQKHTTLDLPDALVHVYYATLYGSEPSITEAIAKAESAGATGEQIEDAVDRAYRQLAQAGRKPA